MRNSTLSGRHGRLTSSTLVMLSRWLTIFTVPAYRVRDEKASASKPVYGLEKEARCGSVKLREQGDKRITFVN